MYDILDHEIHQGRRYAQHLGDVALCMSLQTVQLEDPPRALGQLGELGFDAFEDAPLVYASLGRMPSCDFGQIAFGGLRDATDLYHTAPAIVERHVAHHLAAITEGIEYLARAAALGQLEIGVLQHVLGHVDMPYHARGDVAQFAASCDKDLGERGLVKRRRGHRNRPGTAPHSAMERVGLLQKSRWVLRYMYCNVRTSGQMVARETSIQQLFARNASADMPHAASDVSLMILITHEATAQENCNFDQVHWWGGCTYQSAG